MMERIQAWLRAPGVFESRRRFAVVVAESRAAHPVYLAAERDADGDSVPPPSDERESGPDVLQGVSLGAHP